MGLKLQATVIYSARSKDWVTMMAEIFEINWVHRDEHFVFSLQGGDLIVSQLPETDALLPLTLEFSIDFSLSELAQRVSFHQYRNPDFSLDILEQNDFFLRLGDDEGRVLLIRPQKTPSIAIGDELSSLSSPLS